MDSHQRELLELRKEFNKFDKKDIAAIRKWFADHPYLSTAEHAQAAGKSRWYIRDLRRKAGLTKPVDPNRLPKSTAQKRAPIGIEIPHDWDCKEWLEKAAQMYSVARLCKAIGVDHKTIEYKYRKYGITHKIDGRVSKNPCCTKAWVHKHYVDMNLSQSQCAKLAGIATENFANWLVRFEIPMRRPYPAITVPMWISKLLYQLLEVPVIRRAKHRTGHVHVRTQHFFWESYYYNHTSKRLAFSYNITQEDARLEHIPTVTHQYESELDGINHYPHHLHINTQEWKKASLLERRMAIHTFGQRIFDNKYRQLEHPMAVIEKEYADIGKVSHEKFVRGAGFASFNRFAGLELSPGKRIIENFFDFSDVWKAVFLSPRYITHTLNYLANSGMPISTHTMLTTALNGFDNIRHKKLPNIPTPLVYAAILAKLGIKGSVLDLCTNYGEKAIACALLGLPYVYVPNPSFDHAINRGFADFLNLDCRSHDGSKVDLLICDNGLSELPDLNHVLSMAKYARNMLVFVPRSQRVVVMTKLPPKSVIPIRARFYRKSEDYLFLY